MESVEGANCSWREDFVWSFWKWSLFEGKDSLIQQQHMFQLTFAVSGTPGSRKTSENLVEKLRIVKKKIHVLLLKSFRGMDEFRGKQDSCYSSRNGCRR